MQEQTLFMLLVTAATLAVGHTLAGPDHYVPFVAMSRAGGWTLRKTIIVTILCGLGHVLSSVVIGSLGAGFGWAVEKMVHIEGSRGAVAGWLLLGFGLAYMVWGFRRAARGHTHTHAHVHEDGTVHTHEHTHERAHAHVHASEASAGRMTPWILFTIFVFGPCEVLIPMLMVPAMEKSAAGAALVIGVFAACTIGTMLAVVIAGYYGLRFLPMRLMERYAHALGGFAIAACGGAMIFGL